MLRYVDLGVDELLCYVQFGYLPHESVMTTLELLGKEVIPELQKREVEVKTTVSAPAMVGPDVVEKTKSIID
jgi:hypothetical protein